MRMAIVAGLGLLVILGYMYVTGQLTRPAAEDPDVVLPLEELTGELQRVPLLERLEAGFSCTEDSAVGAGEMACFTGVGSVDGLDAKYIGLFFDAEDRLAAVRVILDPERHRSNVLRLTDAHGPVSQEIENDERTWLTWTLAEGMILTQKEAPADDPPTLTWFREADLAERLMP